MEESQDMFRSLITLGQVGIRLLNYLTCIRFKKKPASRFGMWDVAHAKERRRAARGLCVQPAGAGKTVAILAFVRATTLRWGWRALVIEPTKGLVSKAKRKSEHGRRRSCDFDAGLFA